MLPSVRAMFSGIIDYAGMFPPAQLPLEQAVRNYARYRTEPEAWMLGRFVCPAARLGELSPFVEELFQQGPPLTISALGRGADEGQPFVDVCRADLEAVTGFNRRYGSHARVDALEVRLPGSALFLQSIATNMRWLAPVIDLLRAPELRIRHSYFEPVPDPVNTQLVALTSFLPAWQKASAAQSLGVKLRCGGLEPRAVPAPEGVGFALIACRDCDVPLKFTAGLHQPIRHFDDEVQTTVHGFLNIFAAGILAQARRLPEIQVREIIADDDPAGFELDDAGLRWRGLLANTEEIRVARQQFVTTFGSCSFDEPRDGLRALGLI